MVKLAGRGMEAELAACVAAPLLRKLQVFKGLGFRFTPWDLSPPPTMAVARRRMDVAAALPRSCCMQRVECPGTVVAEAVGSPRAAAILP